MADILDLASEGGGTCSEGSVYSKDCAPVWRCILSQCFPMVGAVLTCRVCPSACVHTVFLPLPPPPLPSHHQHHAQSVKLSQSLVLGASSSTWRCIELMQQAVDAEKMQPAFQIISLSRTAKCPQIQLLPPLTRPFNLLREAREVGTLRGMELIPQFL